MITDIPKTWASSSLQRTSFLRTLCLTNRQLRLFALQCIWDWYGQDYDKFHWNIRHVLSKMEDEIEKTNCENGPGFINTFIELRNSWQQEDNRLILSLILEDSEMSAEQTSIYSCRYKVHKLLSCVEFSYRYIQTVLKKEFLLEQGKWLELIRGNGCYVRSMTNCEWLPVAGTIKDNCRIPSSYPLVDIPPEWLTCNVVQIASQAYHGKDWFLCSVLADALSDAGCTDEPILNYLRTGPYFRGVKILDLLRGFNS